MYLVECFVIIVGLCQLERSMGFKRLSHFKISKTGIRKWSNALCQYTSNRHVWIFIQISNVGNYIFRKYRSIRRRDGFNEYQLVFMLLNGWQVS